jgi:hypothetical protein
MPLILSNSMSDSNGLIFSNTPPKSKIIFFISEALIAGIKKIFKTGFKFDCKSVNLHP